MFDRYLITADSVRNIEEDGRVVGFSFAVRIGYYRGLAVSMVEPFDVVVDGVRVDDDDITFTVKGETLSYQEMEPRADLVWEMRDDAIITVRREGGLAPGDHRIDLTERLRISYNRTTAERHDSKTVRAAA